MLQDMVIPAFKPPADVASSPLLGGPVRERTHLLFFRGDVGLHRLPSYSRGIRQEAHACLSSCCRADSTPDSCIPFLQTGAVQSIQGSRLAGKL